MLTSEPTRYGAGITLWDDCWDLRSLRETVYHLTGPSPLSPSCSDFVLALAYDVRHAEQKDRREKTFRRDDMDKVTYQGVDILWPYFLMQAALLRWSAGFHVVSSDDQANLYRLESCAEHALLAQDAAIGKPCVDWLRSFPGLPTTYIPEFITDCTRQYVCNGRPGKARFRKLPQILCAMMPPSPQYEEFEKHITVQAASHGCSPDDLSSMDDWPDFKW
jgi:hypothetical protein